MLMTMKAQTEAMRMLAYYAAAQMDVARRHPEEAVRKRAHGFLDLLIPVVKSWCTDTAVEVANTGIQVHGGMGFVEETGAAQHLRDARIHPIYEGTNGIQANDLMGRKVLRDGGEVAKSFIEEMREVIGPLAEAGNDDLTALRKTLEPSLDALEAATDWMVHTGQENIALAASSAVPYLNLFGNTTTGWLMAQAALAAAGRLAGEDGDGRFLEAKVQTARFFGDQILNRSPGLCATVTAGGGPALALEEELF
jgi:acyl-CoA dehydrogenase